MLYEQGGFPKHHGKNVYTGRLVRDSRAQVEGIEFFEKFDSRAMKAANKVFEMMDTRSNFVSGTCLGAGEVNLEYFSDFPV